MDTIFHSLYCMSMSEVLLLGVMMTLLFFLLKQAWANAPGWKVLMAALALFWAAAAVRCTLLTRDSCNGGLSLVPLHSYWEVLHGGSRERLRSNLMNTILFYPLGLIGWELLPAALRPKTRMLILLLAAFTFSVTIECLQYLGALGLAETDDVIHNTLGTALASSLCRIRSERRDPP